MIIRSFKFCSYFTIKLAGWSVIAIAAFKIAIPFFLPLTLNDAWVEKVVGQYFQEVKIGSVHVVIDDGKLALLLQNIDTPASEARGIHVTRAYVSPSPWKSLWNRKLVFNKITLYAGDLHMGFGKDHVRLGAVKIPIHPNQQLPVWVHHLNLKHLKVHFDEIDELSDVYIHEVHLLNPKQKGLLKAKITEDKSNVAAAEILFDFEKQYNDINGQLYIRGYDHKLTRVFKWLNWPGSTMEGKADYEFWAKVRHGKIEDAVVDLSGRDLTLSKPHGRLQIDKLSGRLGYSHDKKGQRWTGENLTLQLEDSLLNTEFTIISQPNQDLVIRGSNFDIGLIHFITQDVPQVDSFFQSFDLLPKGNIPFVQMSFENFAYTPTSVLMQANDLSFKRNDIEVKGLDGQLYYLRDTITAQLQGDGALLKADSMFSEPLDLSPYEFNLHYDLPGQRLQVAASAGKQMNYMEASLDLFLQTNPIIDFKIASPVIDVQALRKWIPFKTLKPTISTWLNHSLKTGTFREFSFGYTGYVSEFTNPDNPEPFAIHAKLDNVTLDYAAPWPSLTLESGTFKLANHGMQVEGDGHLEQAKLNQLKATIADFRESKVILDVKGNIKDNLNTAWDVLHETRLVEPHTYQELSFDAPMSLDLKLQMAFSAAPVKTTVQGTCRFENGRFNAQGLPELTDFSGAVGFNNHGLHSKQLSGYLWGNPSDHQLNVQFGPKGNISLESQGLVDVATFLPNIANGKAPFNARLGWDFAKQYANVRGSVSLDNVTIDAPKPLDKRAGELASLTLAANIKPGKSGIVILDYEDKVQSQILFKREGNKLAPKAAAIHFGEPETIQLPESDIVISGHLDALYADDWLAFKDVFGTNGNRDTHVAFDLTIDDFISNAIYLNDVTAQGFWSSKKQRAQVALSSPKLQGTMDLNLGEGEPWRFKLDRLYLSEKVDTNHDLKLPMRPLQLEIGHFKNQTVDLKRFNLSLIPNNDGFVINDLSFAVKDSHVDVTGLWQNKHSPEHVKLAGTVRTKNIEHVLHSIGKPASIKGAKGEITFEIGYKGSLFDPLVETVRGQGDVHLKSGSIPGVNPGIGRILSLLNLDTLQRRLQFDFSDVTKEGYAFDTLEGKFHVSHGQVKTDKLRVEAPTANIDFFGSMDLVDKQLNAEVAVMPNVTGSLPLAAAIAAGNPAVGAAVWLMDKFVGKKIQEMTRYTYLVSGPLDSPDIKEVSDASRYNRR